MKNLIYKKQTLQTLAEAFATLADQGHQAGEKTDEYWTENRNLTLNIAGRLQGVPHQSESDQKITVGTLLELAEDSLQLRNSATDQEGREYWQGMLQFLRALADEITDLIPVPINQAAPSMAVY